MHFTNKVKLSINKIGGPTRASNQLGVSNGTIHSWIKAERIPNIDHAKKLAQLSDMNVEELRPV